MLLRRYEASMEAYLEEAYQQYKARKGKQAEVQRAKRARLGLPEIASDEEAHADAIPHPPLPVPEFQVRTLQSDILLEMLTSA